MTSAEKTIRLIKCFFLEISDKQKNEIRTDRSARYKLVYISYAIILSWLIRIILLEIF